jgi:hypothetical protein
MLPLLSVQDFHDHFAKYTTIPESWHSKNHAFEFLKCINSVTEKQLLAEKRKIEISYVDSRKKYSILLLTIFKK